MSFRRTARRHLRPSGRVLGPAPGPAARGFPAQCTSGLNRTAPSTGCIDVCAADEGFTAAPPTTVGAPRRTKRGWTVAKGMTKSETISYLAAKCGVEKKAAAKMLETIATLATKETKSSGQFVIPGLGKAVKANRKARMGRNPATGEAIKIPAKTVVKFRLAKAFKDAVVPPKK